jgi:hypothetical protein
MSSLAGRTGGLFLAIVLALIIAYASRFWPWGGFWSTEGALGIAWLHPDGDWVRRALRGTAFARFDLLIWGGLAFLLLSIVHAVGSRFKGQSAEAADEAKD